MKKKIAKKSSVKRTNSSLTSFDSVAASRAIIGLLIVLLAASILALFVTYQNNIMINNMFYPFITLTVICMGLLVALLFLINPHHPKRK